MDTLVTEDLDLDSRKQKSLTARITIALIAGFIVRIGQRVFALRDAGETIDDGKNAVEAIYDGLFERLNGYQYQADQLQKTSEQWTMIYQGSSPRRLIAEAVERLDEYAIDSLMLSFTVAAALTKNQEIVRAFNTGIRLDEPPTQIIGDDEPPAAPRFIDAIAHGTSA